MRMRRRVLSIVLVFTLGVPGVGCSMKRMAANKVGDALASGGDTYGSDDDPELIKAALPFSLKLMESLLAVSPQHRGLLLASASGFTQYAYAFVQQDAEAMEDIDFEASDAMRDRARRLYLRARDYGMRGLEVGHDGFEAALREDPWGAVVETEREDVAMLYWTATSWAAAIGVSKDDPDLVGDLPIVEALIERALELDESFDHGAIHSFLITYEMSRIGGEALEMRAREHFERAMELSDGQLAAPLVVLAESVAVAEQDMDEFHSLLDRALAIDPDARPEWRLSNLVYQKRARWLLERADRLFLD